MMNTELKNTLRKYLGTDLSSDNLESVTSTLNEVLDEIRAEQDKAKQEKAKKTIQKAKDADFILETMRDYVLNYYELSDKYRETIKEHGIGTRETFDYFFDTLIPAVELVLSFDINNTKNTTPKTCKLNEIANINSDALAKFVSKFDF